MRRALLISIAVIAATLLAPTAASGGYDIAHIIERTCAPGGPLLVKDEWKPRLGEERDRRVTQPGQVVACPPKPARGIQIAAAPEAIGGETYTCTYFSHRGGAGLDVCSSHSALSRPSFVRPLLIARSGRGSGLALYGIASADTAEIVGRPSPAPSDWILFPVDRARAELIGAPDRFRYFVMRVSEQQICWSERPRLLARDSDRRILDRANLSRDISLLDPSRRSRPVGGIKGLCQVDLPPTDYGLDPVSTVGIALMRFAWA